MKHDEPIFDRDAPPPPPLPQEGEHDPHAVPGSDFMLAPIRDDARLRRRDAECIIQPRRPFRQRGWR